MGDTIKLKKGLKVNRPALALSELTCDNNTGNERLVYGGVNGAVEFPNIKDIEKVTSDLADIAYNIKSFGAKGDGITDDIVVIQNVINSLTQGGTIYFPRGIYLISATIAVHSNIKLVGSGQLATTIKLKNNSNCDLLNNYNSSAQDFAVTNIIFDGNGINQTIDCDVLNFVDNTGSIADEHLLLENIKVINAKHNGIKLNSQIREARLINVVVQGASNYGIHAACTDSYFSLCTVLSANKHGFYVEGGSNKFVSCKGFYNGDIYTTDNTVGDGFYINGPCTQLTSCESQENARNGFTFAGDSIIGAALISNTNGRVAIGIGVCFAFINSARYCNIQGLGVQITGLNGLQKALLQFSTLCGYNYINITNVLYPDTHYMLDIFDANIPDVTNTILINGNNLSLHDFINYQLLDSDNNGIVDGLISGNLGGISTTNYYIDYLKKQQIIDVISNTVIYQGSYLKKNISCTGYNTICSSLVAALITGQVILHLVFLDINSAMISDTKSSAITLKNQEVRVVTTIPANTVSIDVRVDAYNLVANGAAKVGIISLKAGLYK
ncbi:glycoside hydrolase family 55 protein [Clostridium tagluense]|uniref:glycoside hydrolase family 55 protein n=1 Tax=Clostridium tagluense TaxID=360422 RepID=UPI001C0D3E5B|nr:glycoside hydrolase family 55 protein [Clostridium tagluense]MBU3126734.1 glycoside hydrolase family 55 protein [Clostridium tagluense]